jgi:tetratricopeptide (TPR) repeat protein
MRIAALGQFIHDSSGFSAGVLQKLLSIFVIFSAYLVKQFVPFDINAFHHFHPVEGVLDPRLLWSVAALLAFSLLAYWQRKNRQAVFLFGFCLISLLPLLNIASLSGENLFADRYLYLPSLAACILIPILIRAGLDLRPNRSRVMVEKILYVLVAAVIIIYGVVLLRTSSMWKDAPTLYTESLRKSPESIIPANLLAQYYFNRNEYEKAEPLFRRIIEMSKSAYVKNNVRLSSAYIGLGGIELHRNNLQRAKELFIEANKLNPRDAAVLQNLGSVHLTLGDAAAATKYFQESLKANPRNEIVYNNLAVLNLELGNFERAILNAQKAVEIFPKFGKAYINMAQAYAALGMKEKARNAYKTAISVDPVQKPLAEKHLEELEKSSLQD